MKKFISTVAYLITLTTMSSPALAQNGTSLTVSPGESRLGINIATADGLSNDLVAGLELCSWRKGCIVIDRDTIADLRFPTDSTRFANVAIPSDFTADFALLKQSVQSRRLSRTFLLPIIFFDKPLNFRADIGLEAFFDIEIEKRSPWFTIAKAHLAASRPVAPTEQMIRLLRPGQTLIMATDDGKAKLTLDGRANRQAQIVSLEVQSNDNNEINVQYFSGINEPLIGELEFAVSDPTLRPGALSEDFSLRLGRIDTPFEFVGNDGDTQHYNVGLLRSGAASLLRKDTLERLREGRQTPSMPDLGLDVVLPSDALFSAPSGDTSNTGITNEMEADAGFRTASAIGATTACGQQIRNVMENAAEDYFDVAKRTRSAVFNDCVDRYPYVHIAIHVGTFASSRSDYVADPTSSADVYELQTLETLNGLSTIDPFFSVNGFLFSGIDGAEGTGPGQFGRFIATQYRNGTPILESMGAEVAVGFTDPEDNSASIPQFFDKPAGQTLQPSPFDHDVISSRSSILKAGTCRSSAENPGPRNFWSTLGVKDQSGRRFTVVLSSVSDEKSTPFELCDIYHALEVDDALRLDGGPSAALVVNGLRRNPLTYPERFKYGTSRHIISGFSFGKPR